MGPFELPGQTLLWSIKLGDHTRNGEENPQNGIRERELADIVSISENAFHHSLSFWVDS